MKVKGYRIGALMCALFVLVQPGLVTAHTGIGALKIGARDVSEAHDGQHDFDFEIGTWKVHISSLKYLFTSSSTWLQYDGTFVVHKLWNGANLIEVDVSGPSGRMQGLSLQLYDPQSHQWSLNFASSDDGVMNQPTIGAFKNGRGEFFDQETVDGRAIFVRKVWQNIPPDSGRFEEAYSEDGGKTWKTYWIAKEKRINGVPRDSH